MEIAVAVRPIGRFLAAHILPSCFCPGTDGVFLVQGRRFSKRPIGVPRRRFTSSCVRAAVAPAKDETGVSDFRRLSTAAGTLQSGSDRPFERILVQGFSAVKPLVIERVESENELLAVLVVEKEEEEMKRVVLKVAEERKETAVEKEAWRLLNDAVVSYCGSPVGTVAANVPSAEALNYDQVFIRDFVASAIAFLLKGETEIVRNFLLHTLQLQELRKYFTKASFLSP